MLYWTDRNCYIYLLNLLIDHYLANTSFIIISTFVPASFPTCKLSTRYLIQAGTPPGESVCFCLSLVKII